jgi:hypothetical protein
MDVAERQILALGTDQGAQVRQSKPKTALEPGPLGPDDAKALGDFLAQMCRGAKRVRISSTSQTDIEPGGSGLTLWPLRKAAALPDVIASQSGTTTWLDAVVDSAKVSVHSAVLIDVDEAHVIIGSKEEAEALADWAVEMLDVFLADGFPLAPELETKGAITFAPAAERLPRAACGPSGSIPAGARVRARHCRDAGAPGSMWPIMRSTASSPPPDPLAESHF